MLGTFALSADNSSSGGGHVEGWKTGVSHCNQSCSCVECLNRDFDEIDDESHSESDEEELCDSSLSDDE